MLLSRVANSLYWMGRYLERAENANRHLVVAGEFAIELEGIQDEIALKEWDSLIASMPSGGARPNSEGPAAMDYMASFLVDKENPYSVICSLAKARDNARSVGEAITLEITTNLNESYRRLNSVRRSVLTDPGRTSEVASSTHNSILTTLGAVEHTLTRGEGWSYMKLGEAMERTQRTLYVLKTRLPNLARWQDQADTPLYFASWRSLLRALACLENYRQVHGPRFVPEAVTRFLLFHASTPRSVNCGVKRMIGYLQGMSESGPGIQESRRRLGKLGAQLEFDDAAIMRDGCVAPFLDEALQTLLEVHDAVSNPMRLR